MVSEPYWINAVLAFWFDELDEAGWTRYAQLPKDLIDRFGRFPGRNIALGRQSPPAELAALPGPDTGF